MQLEDCFWEPEVEAEVPSLAKRLPGVMYDVKQEDLQELELALRDMAVQALQWEHGQQSRQEALDVAVLMEVVPVLVCWSSKVASVQAEAEWPLQAAACAHCLQPQQHWPSQALHGTQEFPLKPVPSSWPSHRQSEQKVDLLDMAVPRPSSVD